MVRRREASLVGGGRTARQDGRVDLVAALHYRFLCCNVLRNEHRTVPGPANRQKEAMDENSTSCTFFLRLNNRMISRYDRDDFSTFFWHYFSTFSTYVAHGSFPAGAVADSPAFRNW